MIKRSIARDTVIMTVIQIALQVLSLLMNIFITRSLGTASVGIASLIYTFFGLAAILATGNIFVIISRFASEELGKSEGNALGVLKYGIICCLILSTVVSVGVFFSANLIDETFLKNAGADFSIKLLAFSLVPVALCSCFKGFFNAHRKILIPLICEAAEFFIKSGVLAFLIIFMVKSGRMSIFTAIAISIIISEICGIIYMLIEYLKNWGKEKASVKASIRFRDFIKLSIPILLNSYIISILSSTNEALLPLTLKQFGESTQSALSSYGIFEGIILPVIFFPAVALSSMSGILIPEISRERAAKNHGRVSQLIENSLKQTFLFSIFVVMIFLTYGKSIGMLLSGGNLAGQTIVILSPVVPFIYLEIVLEGILKGLGLHGFSTFNYLIEYIIRISVVLICVPLIGFTGIIISYFASNITCNVIRIIKITKITHFDFNAIYLILIPVFSSVLSWQAGTVIMKILQLDHLPPVGEIVIYIIITGIIYLILHHGITALHKNRERKEALIKSV